MIKSNGDYSRILVVVFGCAGQVNECVLKHTIGQLI